MLLEGAKVLVAAGADINKQCEHGWTALHMAACWGHLDVIRFLVEKGANWKLRDVSGRTPAELARDSDCVSQVKIHDVISYFSTLEG